MNYQESIIESTRAAMDEAFKYAKKVPADKLEWRPLDSGRSVLDICKELACCPRWAEQILGGQPMPEFDEQAIAAMKAEQDAWDTPEKCEAECQRNLESFYRAVQHFPDERLEETYVLPFDGGQTITLRENMDYPRWNATYHLGQIAYIQTLYGDRQVYW